MKITGLREITIGSYEEISKKAKRDIERKINYVLKEVDLAPMPVWKIDWKDLEDEISPVPV